MKLSNLLRAVSAREELERLEKALKAAKELSSGFVISDNRDDSGALVDYQYANGYHHPMYEDIKQFIINKLEEARENLLTEIASL